MEKNQNSINFVTKLSSLIEQGFVPVEHPGNGENLPPMYVKKPKQFWWHQEETRKINADGSDEFVSFD